MCAFPVPLSVASEPSSRAADRLEKSFFARAFFTFEVKSRLANQPLTRFFTVQSEKFRRNHAAKNQTKERHMETTKQTVPNLTPEQRERCREVLETHTLHNACEVLAEPPPIGIGARISPATACRLKRSLALEQVLDERADLRSQAEVLAREEKSEHVRDAAIQLVRERAFQCALSGEANLLQLSRVLQQLDQLEKRAPAAPDLAALRLQVAKRALLRLDDLGAIRSNKALNAEQQTLMVADRLFGELRQ